MFCASMLDQSLREHPTKANDIWEPSAAEIDPSGADSRSLRPFSSFPRWKGSKVT